MTTDATRTDRLPVAYLSHGAPPLADDATWTAELAAWGKELPEPKQILMVSAHWENAPVTVSSTSGAGLVHDFWGFPQKYYEVAYDAPAAPELAESVARLVGSGFTTHNLRWFRPGGGADDAPPAPSSEFDHWAAETMASGDLDALFDFMTKSPAVREAHPRTEHWAPLYVALGAANPDGAASTSAQTTVDGFWYGLSKRSWQLA